MSDNEKQGEEMADVISFPHSRSQLRTAQQWPGTLIDLEAAREMAGERASEDEEYSSSPEPEVAASTPARQIALRSLAARGRSVAEIRQKLRDRGIDDDVAEAEIQRLQRDGVLDDVALAEQLVWSLREHKKLGSSAIRQSLAKRKIPGSIIDQVLAGLPQTDQDDIVALAEARLRTLGGLEREVQVRRLVGYLARRGYTGPDVFRAVDRAVGGR